MTWVVKWQVFGRRGVEASQAWSSRKVAMEHAAIIGRLLDSDGVDAKVWVGYAAAQGRGPNGAKGHKLAALGRLDMMARDMKEGWDRSELVKALAMRRAVVERGKG